ncbi:MAG TPA: AAA family ATPase [Candidatus Baltobacteraceae bacterium]|nr:AAA family ATPase [Candidatus Baltobacteraceae bacterium]
MIARPIVNETFVGRREPLAFLENEFRLAREGAARVVMLEGDAGIGKTRLVDELAARLAPRAAVVRGRCEAEIVRAYDPFVAILRQLETRGRNRVTHLDRASGTIRDDAGFRDAVLATLAREGARKPLLCVVDDVHAADAGTLALLAYALRELRSARVLLVVAYRLEDDATERRLAALRSAATRAGGATLRLERLARNEMRDLLQRCAAARDVRVPPETFVQIEELADGNPLFAEELLGAALRDPALRLDRDVPLSARAIAAARLAGFDDEERDVLVHAAVAGRWVDAPLVAALVERPPARIAGILRRAVACGLLDADDDRFRFRHEIVRRVLGAELVFALAAPLHVRIATALENDPSASAAELAQHWAAARVPDRARRWFETAAGEAQRAGAYRDAIRYYSEALRCNYPPGEARAAVYERLGTVLYRDGCRDEPLPRFTRCRDERTALRDALGAARALLLIADQHWVDGRTTESLASASEAARALERLDRPELAAQAALAAARFEITLGRPVRAEAELRAAEIHAGALTAELRANLHEIRAEVRAAYGETRGALRDCAAASRIARRTGDGELVAMTENNVALVACDLGHVELALRHHRRALDAAVRSAIPWRIAYCALNFARSLTLAGDLTQARTLLDTALETGVDTPTFRTKAASVGIPLALLVGDRRLADASADPRALEIAWGSGEIQRIGSVSASMAELRAAGGDADGARAIVRRALDAVPHVHRCWPLVLAAARFGDAADLTRARDLVARSRGRARVRRAHRILLQAFAGEPGSAARVARGRLAARQFAAIGWLPSRIVALECAGDREEADALRAQIGAARPDRASSDAAPEDPVRALSHRQRQIAELIALGATNREIAARLHISEHTVEHHVSHVFTRLGVRSRARLAALVSGRAASA